MNEPRRDRWIRLYDLGRSFQRSDETMRSLGRRALRQRVHRMVREAEAFHGELFTKRWRNRVYVNVSAIDRIKPIEDRRLGQIEVNLTDANSKLRHLERQQNAHGARIRNLEKWRELTSRYLQDVAALECTENDSKSRRRSG